MRNKTLAASVAVGVVLVGLGAPSAHAASPTPAREACSNGAEKYACIEVDRRTAPVGEMVTFTGTLSAAALKYLKSWTRGSNVICLDRYATAPNANGWSGTALEGACTTVRSNGAYTINAEFGRVGRFYYGVSMGPCRSTEAECGGGDPGLVGVGGPTVVSVRTTA